MPADLPGVFGQAATNSERLGAEDHEILAGELEERSHTDFLPTAAHEELVGPDDDPRSEGREHLLEERGSQVQLVEAVMAPFVKVTVECDEHPEALGLAPERGAIATELRVDRTVAWHGDLRRGRFEDRHFQSSVAQDVTCERCCGGQRLHGRRHYKDPLRTAADARPALGLKAELPQRTWSESAA